MKYGRIMCIVELFFIFGGFAIMSGCEKKPAANVPSAATEAAKEAVTDVLAAAENVFVNSKCPIMGTVIDAKNVPDSLTRRHKGQKVAFCCGGCPAAWDKLTETEKDEKLAKVLKK